MDVTNRVKALDDWLSKHCGFDDKQIIISHSHKCPSHRDCVNVLLEVVNL
jgi:hypothetical protein